ncbi:hypothetical protein [Roseateles sp. P5_E11]
MSKWLGDADAYVSQTQSGTRRLIEALQMIQADPMYVGHVSDRLVRMTPWSVERLKHYLADPALHRERLNYHVCAISSSMGELLIQLTEPPASLSCQGQDVRSQACRALIAAELQKFDSKAGDMLQTACRWG